jgi:uncharacterized membrane protein
MESLIFLLTFLAALGSGVMAGLFFAFSAFIMRAFGRLPWASGIAAMQSINVTILNPVFFAVFLGTPAACVLLAIAAVVRWPEPGSLYLLVGSLLHLVGSFVVTVAFNVPLNNRLAAVSADSLEGATVWTAYLSIWTAWNHVRTLACLAATASFIMALR